MVGVLHLPGGLDAKIFDAMEDMFFIQTEDKLFGEDWLNCNATESWTNNMCGQMSLMLLTN